MRRSSRSTEPVVAAADDPERGSAALEFIVVGLLLLVPVVYLVVTLGMIQGQALGAEAGARHIARAISTAATVDDARVRADAVLRGIVDEYGMDASSVDFALECVPRAAVCPEAGATIVVRLRAQVALPLAPPVLGLERIASIPVEGTAAHRMSRFWGSE